ncbi:acyltransferase [Sphingopyxis sp. KK2]|uniref:acyltransferase n=1 Tax=Sphingopyxis sp. KK2 TaxID=1855727 RepID=UPI00097E72D2|nr:acyltransferase [Sphingopyxis sp. KK2]
MTRTVPWKARFAQHGLGINGGAYWPMHPASQLDYPNRVLLGRGSWPGIEPFCYVSANMGIVIGDGVSVGRSVGLISGNHDPVRLTDYLEGPPLVIGDHCVIEEGCTILPGVELADFCIVTRGSVVTRSCFEPRSILSGNPAKIVGTHDRPVPVIAADARHGYVAARDFADFARRNLRHQFLGRFAAAFTSPRAEGS